MIKYQVSPLHGPHDLSAKSTKSRRPKGPPARGTFMRNKPIAMRHYRPNNCFTFTSPFQHVMEHSQTSFISLSVLHCGCCCFWVIFVSGGKKEKATRENGRIVRGRQDFLSILLHCTIFSFSSSYLILFGVFVEKAC